MFTGKISKPITGSYLTLWQRVPGAWVLRASIRTTAGGVYKFSYVSAYTGTWAFRTMIGVKDTTALAISAYRTVPIQDRKIVVNTSAAWYATLTGVSVTGRMTPAEPGKELALQDYLGSGKWRLLSIAKMDAAGNFRLRVPDDVPSSRTVRVLTRGVAQPAMEYSGLAKIVVKAALNPKVYAVSAAMVRNTYRAGCPVKPASLRLLQLNYWGFDGKVHRGELVLRDAAVSKMITVWTSTFASKFRSGRCGAWTCSAAVTSSRWRPTTPPRSTAPGSPVIRTRFRRTRTAGRSTSTPWRTRTWPRTASGTRRTGSRTATVRCRGPACSSRAASPPRAPPELPEQATAPPPATAGPLSARNLPAAEQLGTGWKTYADPGGAEAGFLGNKTWTRKRDAHQAAFEALPSGCSGQPVTGSLPVPQYALAGTYRTGDALPATALLLRFTDAGKATAYYAGYQSRMKACGSGGDLSIKQLWSDQSAAAAVRGYAGAESYVDISVAQGSTVALLAATSASADTQSSWAHTVVPTLQAVIDQP